MPPPAYQDYTIALIVLACVAIAILLLILIVLFRINGRIAAISSYLSRQNRSAKPEETDPMELGLRSHFAEFLTEDPERRALTKKEQFKAYRAWRSEKGLNWPTND